MDLLRAAARNQASHHDATLRAHGKRTQWSDGLWRCFEPGGGPFLAALTTEPGVDTDATLEALRELAAARPGLLVFWDCFAEVDAAALGFFRLEDELLYVRPAGPPPDVPAPEGLEIRLLSDPALLGDWQAVERAAFEAPPLESPMYPASLLDDPRFYLFLGQLEGRDVGVATAIVAEGVTGIYDVGTTPEARGHGIASALMARALSLAPYAPSVLEPSDMAQSMYRRLGYREVARIRRWANVDPKEWQR